MFIGFSWVMLSSVGLHEVLLGVVVRHCPHLEFVWLSCVQLGVIRFHWVWLVPFGYDGYHWDPLGTVCYRMVTLSSIELQWVTFGYCELPLDPFGSVRFSWGRLRSVWIRWLSLGSI